MAQIVAPNRSDRLAPIPDQAAAAAKIGRLDLGQTAIDFNALSPKERAELIRLLAAPAEELQLRAWDGAGPVSEPEALQIDRREVSVDTGQTDGIWWFEYVNTGRSARRARWQLSRLPFSSDVNNWRSPPGLVAQGEIEDVKRGEQPNRFKLQIGNFLLGTVASNLDMINTPGQTVTSMLHSEFPTGKLYLRVLGLGRSSAPIGAPSNTVEITVMALPGQSGQRDGLPQIVATPTLQPPRVVDADFQCHFIATRDFELPGLAKPGELEPGPGMMFKAGQSVNACLPAPQGLLGNFESHEGSAAFIRNNIHSWDGERFKHAQNEVYEAVMRNFGGPSGGCNSHCRQALALALDRGVAGLGVPSGSSLADPKISQASAYLRYLVTDALRISDLPEVVHAQASERAIKVFADTMLSPSHATPPPFEPDPAHMGMPALLTVTLGAAETETGPTYLQLREISRNPRLRSEIIAIPSIPAGTEISVPIRLTSTEIPTPESLWALQSIVQMTAGLSDASVLLRNVHNQLGEAQQRQRQLVKRQRRGSYALELSWRSADGPVIKAATLRCKASSGECKMR